jgi:predicted metal-dependent peptidase
MSDSTLSEKSKVVTVTNPRVDIAAREKLITARVGLLLKAPFFGNLATRLIIQNADAWCPTAATEGRHFFYNSEFINRLSLKECEFLFGHEVLHVVYDHMGRRGDREPRLWNIADDYCVNADLIEHKIGDKITKVPILYNNKYQGWSAEEVYDDLYKNASKVDVQKLLEQVLDEHLDGDEEGDDDGDGDGNGNKEGNNGRPRLSKEEKKAIRDEIKEAVLAAAEAAGAGNVPGNIKRMIKDLTAPVVNWRELLQQQIQSIIKNDYSWTRPSRRGWHMDAILPGMKNAQTIDICVAIDTSGSITNEDLKLFLSEVKGIMDMYDDYKVHIITWDTEVYNPADYSPDSSEDITSYEPGGGGGTDPHCVWEYLKENDIEPKKLIMFTDFCFFGWSPEQVQDYCDTVWVIKGNPEATPEFGIWAHYEEASKGKK